MRVVVPVLIALVAQWAAPPVARAADPDPSQCVAPNGIILVGLRDGVPDPSGRFDVLVKDSGGNPLAFVPVTVAFGACSDLAPSAVQPYPGLIVDCNAKSVGATTDANGVARFLVLGSVLHRADASNGCAQIRAGTANVLIKTLSRVAVYDLDGVNGVGANDLDLWFCDLCLLLCPFSQRADYDLNGTVFAPDFALLSDRYWAGTSSETGARCDGQPVVKPTILASDGGLNLRWSDCVAGGGTSLATFNCLANAGSHRLVFSFVAPSGVTGATSFEAEAFVVTASAGTPIPDWWRFDACRPASGGIAASQSVACPNPGSGGLALHMDAPWLEPNGARLRFVGLGDLTGLVAGQEYALFDLTIDHQKTAGSGACAGCAEPVQIVFKSLKLIQGGGCGDPAAARRPEFSAAPDVRIESEATGRRAYWQQVVTAVEPPVSGGTLAIARAGGDPRELVIDFSLPTAAPAAIDVFDVGGRRLVSRALQGLGAGSHRVKLAGAGELPAGVYFVRLRQGATSGSLEAALRR